MGTHHFWGSPYTMEAFFDEILTAKRVTNSAGLRHFWRIHISLGARGILFVVTLAVRGSIGHCGIRVPTHFNQSSRGDGYNV